MIFGNAKGGTPLIQSAQTIGIDLPLRALVWEDAEGATFPIGPRTRHGVAQGEDAAVSNMSTALRATAKSVTAP